MVRYIRVFLHIVDLISRINWFKFIKLIKLNSANVILLSFPRGKFGTELISWDFSYINYHISTNKNFCIALKYKDFYNKNIYWSPSKYVTKNRNGNYSKELVDFAKQVEINNNIFPSSKELNFLENKCYMHDVFLKNKIRTPKTKIYSSKEKFLNDKIDYPILIKGEHSSGSKDVTRINSESDALIFFNNTKYLETFENIIVQDLINMRKDIRITIVGNEVVLYYWRINPSDSWMPTSSDYGSFISFENYPKKWHQHFLETFKKTGLIKGAFDVCWQNDDLDTEPYYLEVSPRFSPNPSIDLKNKNYNYKTWKKMIFHKTPYYKLKNKLIFDISINYLKQI